MFIIYAYLSTQAISHPYYNSQNFNNDITLLRLSSPVQMTSRVSPVCLASSSTNIPSGTKCVTTGWGKTGQTCESLTTFIFKVEDNTLQDFVSLIVKCYLQPLDGCRKIAKVLLNSHHTSQRKDLCS